VDRELVINSKSSEVSIALLEDKSLVKLHTEKNDNNYSVGDVYLGRVKKIMPGLNAAFIDVGYKKDAFLHYLDLGPQINTFNKYTALCQTNKLGQITMDNFKLENDIEKAGKISKVLRSGQKVLVQISKEPISTKGPRTSAEISFAGRFLVLIPFSNRISISQKIKNPVERKRLRRLIQSIKPNNFGVIIRTVADKKRVAELDTDLKDLVSKWTVLTKKLMSAKAPCKIASELDRTSAILRDILNESFNNVWLDNKILFEETKNYIHTIAPQKTDIVKYFSGNKPIFEHFGVDKQIKSSFGKTVTIKSGVYLVIEHTEALHVIDINSGHRVNKDNSQEVNALQVNLEAAAEVARQLRLRDMGGIIVIDFIDLHEAKNRRELFQKMKDEMVKDDAKHTVLPPTKFGLIQITRQRVRPEMNVNIIEECPVCSGTGKIKPSIIFTDEIENNLKYLIQDQNEKKLKLNIHPYLYAFITKGLYSMQMKWYFEFGKWIKVQSMPSYHFLEYHFFNKNDDEIKI
jgi:ribonuclease G